MFGDWLAINMPDPDHSKGEQRYVYEEGANIVLLEPDVAAAFPNRGTCSVGLCKEANAICVEGCPAFHLEYEVRVPYCRAL